jgi:hypothetical protein
MFARDAMVFCGWLDCDSGALQVLRPRRVREVREVRPESKVELPPGGHAGHQEDPNQGCAEENRDGFTPATSARTQTPHSFAVQHTVSRGVDGGV